MAKPLFQLLQEYGSRENVIPMHMPGHKRHAADYLRDLSVQWDMTEIPGFDNLHHPEGILLESQRLAAQVFGAENSFYLVNGSTCGILAGIGSLCRSGDTILIARNCHMSVYHGAELFGLNGQYVYPHFDEENGVYTSLSPREAEKALDSCPQARILVVTSPTYEGVVSDLPAICAAAHKRGVPVLVDAAHGAHLGFCDSFPPSPVACGADIVVQSLHKTLPSLTGTAIAHVRDGELARRFAHQLDILQTSSPSYLLLASLDGCVHWLNREGRDDIRRWAQTLTALRQQAESWQNLRLGGMRSLSGCYDYDMGKWLILARDAGTTGKEMYTSLQKAHIQPEMYAFNSVLLMSSPWDEEQQLNRVLACLTELDGKLTHTASAAVLSPPRPSAVCAVQEGIGREGRTVPLSESAGEICGEYVMAYPPGSPVLLPGERIEREAIAFLCQNIGQGVEYTGSLTGQSDCIRVLR